MRCPSSGLISRLLGTSLLVCVSLYTPVLSAAPLEGGDKNEPISFQSDDVTYDQNNDIFTATGHVEIYQDGQIVLADRVAYDRTRDKVMASGRVTLVDKEGQTYFADRLELQNTLKQGFAEDIGLVFNDGSRFAARRIEQPTSDQAVLRNAVYSPCNLCAEDPQKAPLWQIRAAKVVNDKPTKDIYYHNARLETYGVPVVYIPYFSHPQPDVRARSGLMEPVFSAESKTGFIVRNYYYYNFNDQNDATIEVTKTQRNAEILGGQWRQIFAKGKIDLEGSMNYSPVRGGSDERNILKEEDFRGHFFGRGEFDLTDQWRTGFNIRRTVDRFYLKDFDYSQDDILNNELYAERYDDRDFSRISAYYFQDLRPNINTSQPDILPWAEDTRYGDPNDVLGGRWALNSQFMTLLRDAEPSVSRLSFAPSWKRQDIISTLGLKTSVEGKVRSDTYWVQQSSPYDFSADEDGPNTTVTRLFPSTTVNASYPLVNPMKNATALIEPKMALTLAPNLSQNGSIPNEDSRDVQVDISNLFDDSRFPGVDRVESGSHVSYGVKAGGYTDNGNSAFVTLGQSYRLTDNSIFPEGSGLNEDRSDYVGQVEFTFQEKLYLDYRFQMNNSTFKNQRQEVQLAVLQDTYEAGINYLSTPIIEGTGLTEGREQVSLTGAKRVTDKWSVAATTRHDLSGDAGLLNAGLALQYRNECLRASIRGERDLTDLSLGGSESRIMFSLGLRNLGGYDKAMITDETFFEPFGARPRI
ncbi:MAG TPA: LPS assembly protein LptD [Alphaproteobacteria bacterium]